MRRTAISTPAIINYINAVDFTEVPANSAVGQPFGFLDTNGDNFVAPDDALEVINAINAGEGEAESWTMVPSGQAADPVRNPTATENLLALLALDVTTIIQRRRK